MGLLTTGVAEKRYLVQQEDLTGEAPWGTPPQQTVVFIRYPVQGPESGC